MKHLHYSGVIYIEEYGDFDYWLCPDCAKHFLVPQGSTPTCCPYSLLKFDASTWPEVLALYRQHVPEHLWPNEVRVQRRVWARLRAICAEVLANSR